MSDDNKVSPADIISYIGIPLAVLGVVPIFYTFINSLVTSYNIRRKLRQHAVTEGITRSSVLSGIVEVEVPRFSITPHDRDDPDYWALNPHPTRLKGGSWTIFKWNQLATGKKMYRVQFSSDMQVPQAECDFDELLSFLIDRGARPDPKGFRLLNMAGLWTPANTSLLLSADMKESVLRVTFPDDSDGILSLALQWLPGWDNQGGEGLPPHWMKLTDRRLPQTEKSDSQQSQTTEKAKEVQEVNAEDEKQASGSMSDSVREAKYLDTNFPTSVSLHLSMKASHPIINNIQTSSQPSSHRPSLINTNSYISTGVPASWLAILATALGTLQGAPIYTINMPPSVGSLAAKDSLPCGVLVDCGILEESEAPSWATVYDPNEDGREFHAAHMRKAAEMRAEASMAPAQRAAAAKMREARAFQDFVEQGNRRMLRDRERRERREREALESARLGTEMAGQAALRCLSRNERNERGWAAAEQGASSLIQPWTEVQTAAETILFMMLTQDKIGKDVCAILERWKSWTDRGGMNKEDLDLVASNETRVAFCYAIVAMALLKAQGAKKESTLALDLQDCVRTWKRVRLG